MLKVTICGSWSDLEKIDKIRLKFLELGYYVVAPTSKWLNFCMEEILAHHDENRGKESDENARKKALNLLKYFQFIAESDFIYVYNMKDGKPYIGLNTAMEIGVALFLGKPIYFHTEPPDYEFREFSRVWRWVIP